jgi:hypothetical protein
MRLSLSRLCERLETAAPRSTVAAGLSVVPTRIFPVTLNRLFLVDAGHDIAGHAVREPD